MSTSTRITTDRPRSRSRPHRPKNRYPAPDTIDALDTTPFGGAYHHPGPFDPALAARNLNPKYAPLAAVHDSNMKALEATPREYVVDSLERHMPLQGTAEIPPGQPDYRGNIMMYEEGADLMREPDAGGGAYKRWEGMTYHPDDLKGKSEPSYTIEEARKAARNRQRRRGSSLGGDGVAYEMQRRPEPYSDFTRSSPRCKGRVGVAVEEGVSGRRKRSVSDAPRYSRATGLDDGNAGEGSRQGGGLERSQFGSLRKRFGSLRRKAGGG